MAGKAQFVEIRNSGDGQISLPGVTIVSGNSSFTIPASVTEAMGKNQFVLIKFDGANASTDDVSFAGDGLVTLHGPASGFLGNPTGHCGLYRTTGVRSPQLLLDFVAWGDKPGEAASDAVKKRLWPSQDTFFVSSKLPINKALFGPANGPDTEILNGDSIVYSTTLETWIRSAAPTGVTTKNMSIILKPGPKLFHPANGAAFATERMGDLKFIWGADPLALGYRVQISKDDFKTTVVDAMGLKQSEFTPATKLDSGTYRWRAATDFGEGEASDWSTPFEFKINEVPTAKKETSFRSPLKATASAATKPVKINGICYDDATNTPLEGVSISITGLDTNLTSTSNSKGAFTFTVQDSGKYSVKALLSNYTAETVSLSVSGGSSKLSLALKGKAKSLKISSIGARKETNLLVVTDSFANFPLPRTGSLAWDTPLLRATHSVKDLEANWCWAVAARDVARFRGGSGTVSNDEVVFEVKKDIINASGSLDDHLKAVGWALKASAPTAITTYNIKTESKIVASIDSGNPATVGGLPTGAGIGHIMTLSGYVYRDKKLHFIFTNYDNNGKVSPPIESTGQFFGLKFAFVSFPPNAGGRKSDAGVKSDGDSDGVKDFDEEVRMPEVYTKSGATGKTSRVAKDSDGDNIEDKDEIASWVFPSSHRASPFPPDVDEDGLYPELDKDSDGGGIEDGDEDLDRNGTFEPTTTPKETDILDRSDDKVLDLAFVIDSTGSMGDDIAAVKSNLNSILTRVVGEFPNWRIAVVDYKDYPPEDSNPYRAVLSFSNSESAVRSAINSLGASGGGDTPESLFTALVNTVNAVSLADSEGTGWRGKAGDGVKRAIVYMTDAPAQNPEPVTGYGYSNVTSALNSGGIKLGDPSTKSLSARLVKLAAAEVESRSGPISLYPIIIGGSSGASLDADTLVAGTTGGVIRVSGASQVADAIIAAIDDISVAPEANLTIRNKSGVAGPLLGAQSLVGDLSKSYDPEGCGIISYEWDWDADGTYDQTTVVPVVSHVYGTEGFAGKLRARITTFSGDTAVANVTANDEVILDVRMTRGKLVLNKQTGLYEQKVVILNSGTVSVGSLQLVIRDLPTGVKILNNVTNGNIIVRNGEVLPGGRVVFVIKYYDPLRKSFVPDVVLETFSVSTKASLPQARSAIAALVEVNAPTPAPAPAPAPAPELEIPVVIESTRRHEDLTVTLEFSTEVGSTYRIQYSRDSKSWHDITDRVLATENLMKWTDNGPPDTISHPSEDPERFYRVFETSDN